MNKTKMTLKQNQRHKIANLFIFKVVIFRRGETNLHSQGKKRLNTPPQCSAKCSSRISHQAQKNHQSTPLSHPFSGVKLVRR